MALAGRIVTVAVVVVVDVVVFMGDDDRDAGAVCGIIVANRYIVITIRTAGVITCSLWTGCHAGLAIDCGIC